MLASWTAGLSEEEAQRIKDEFHASGYLFDRMNVLLDKMMNDSLTRMRKRTIFDLLSWKDKVASELGTQATLENIKKLIKE